MVCPETGTVGSQEGSVDLGASGSSEMVAGPESLG